MYTFGDGKSVLQAQLRRVVDFALLSCRCFHDLVYLFLPPLKGPGKPGDHLTFGAENW